mgnify:CR=1 FL=1
MTVMTVLAEGLKTLREFFTLPQYLLVLLAGFLSFWSGFRHRPSSRESTFARRVGLAYLLLGTLLYLWSAFSAGLAKA